MGPKRKMLFKYICIITIHYIITSDYNITLFCDKINCSLPFCYYEMLSSYQTNNKVVSRQLALSFLSEKITWILSEGENAPPLSSIRICHWAKSSVPINGIIRLI